MSYGIRNTIILVITLVLMLGGSWLFLRFTYASDIEELEEEISQKDQERSEYAEVAAMYNETVVEHARQLYIRDNHPKELFDDHRLGRIYEYIDQLSRGISFIRYNYSLRDSTEHGDYGTMHFVLNGEAEYRNLNNLIHRIEHSSAIMHIESIQLSNFTDLDRLSKVEFQMELAAYYNRDDRLSRQVRMSKADHLGNIRHNPFYSLVHPVPPNDENRLDVDQSRLIGMTSRFILVRDQDGEMQRLSPGDRVYLGRLQQIDTESNEAVFELVRGGLYDRVVLTLN